MARLLFFKFNLCLFVLSSGWLYAQNDPEAKKISSSNPVTLVETASYALSPGSKEWVPLEQVEESAPKESAGGFSSDPFTVLLRQERAEFQAEQDRKRKEFFSESRGKDFPADEIKERIREFRKGEIERERKFARKQQDKIDKRREKENPVRGPLTPELVKEQAEFFQGQKEESADFFRTLDEKDTAKRRDAISGFLKNQAEGALEFQDDLVKKIQKDPREESFASKLSREQTDFSRRQGEESADFFNELDERDLAKRRGQIIKFRREQAEEAVKFRRERREKIPAFREVNRG